MRRTRTRDQLESTPSGDDRTRREVLAGSAGAAVTVVAAAPVAARQDTDDDFEGWFTADAKGGATGNFDGSVADMTGRSTATVQVGVEGNGGTFAFAPPAMRVDPGTSVTFEWVSNGHNVRPESQPDGADWNGVEEIHDTGFSASHTFDTPGTYTYYCRPHLSFGMKGAIVVAESEIDGPTTDLTPLERTVLGLGIGAGLLAPVGFAAIDRFLRNRAP